MGDSDRWVLTQSMTLAHWSGLEHFWVIFQHNTHLQKMINKESKYKNKYDLICQEGTYHTFVKGKISTLY